MPQGKSKLLIAGLKELGITPSEDKINSFMAYLKEIKTWNRVYNLTSLGKDEDIVIKHFLDSCLYLNALPERTLSLADVGSGAGLPGIPIKIIRPEIDVYLIEPSRKKSAFLRHTIRALGLQGISVIAEGVESTKNQKFDAAVTRAFGSIKEFIKKAYPILKKDGLLIMSKGPKVKEEIGEIRVDYELMPVKLPMSEITRYLVIIKSL